MAKEYKREQYVQSLAKRLDVPLIKVLAGMRRVGKSYLLRPLFTNYLLRCGWTQEQIIHFDLDDQRQKALLRPDNLLAAILKQVVDNRPYVVLLDEIQLVDDFAMLLNTLLHERNLSVYVTGSNSKFLSSDIATQFRGRSETIRVYPLSFAQICREGVDDQLAAWDDYWRYGGLPLVVREDEAELKMSLLQTQANNVYINDLVERYAIRDVSVLQRLIEIVASSIGSLTNPQKIANTFASNHELVDRRKIDQYLNYLQEAFIIEKVERFDVRGRKHISSQAKYYFSDMGVRNSWLSWRQLEENYALENIIYLELRRRGYSVNVGVVNTRQAFDGTKARKQLEVDFIAQKGPLKYYIQSTLAWDDPDKKRQERRSLQSIDDSFKKVVIIGRHTPRLVEEDGILVMDVFDFLLDDKSLELDRW